MKNVELLEYKEIAISNKKELCYYMLMMFNPAATNLDDAWFLCQHSSDISIINEAMIRWKNTAGCENSVYKVYSVMLPNLNSESE